VPCADNHAEHRAVGMAYQVCAIFEEGDYVSDVVLPVRRYRGGACAVSASVGHDETIAAGEGALVLPDYLSIAVGAAVEEEDAWPFFSPYADV